MGAIDPFGNRVPLDSEIAIQERTLTRYGLNLYDGATWEIALALEGITNKENKKKRRTKKKEIKRKRRIINQRKYHINSISLGLGQVAIIYEENILYPGSTGANANVGGIIDIRSDTAEYALVYSSLPSILLSTSFLLLVANVCNQLLLWNVRYPWNGSTHRHPTWERLTSCFCERQPLHPDHPTNPGRLLLSYDWYVMRRGLGGKEEGWNGPNVV